MMLPHRKQRKWRRTSAGGTIQSLLTIIMILIVIGQPTATTELRLESASLTVASHETSTTTSNQTIIIINNDNGKIPSTRQQQQQQQQRQEEEEAATTELDKSQERQQETSEIDKQTSEKREEKEEDETSSRAANKSQLGRPQLSKRAALSSQSVQQQQQQQQQLQFLQQLRVSESELLPFSDFNVQQPAFSDIMKSWPPTTRRLHQQQSGASSAHAARTGGHSGARSGQRLRAQHQQARPPPLPLLVGHPTTDPDDQVPPARNHLNEDYDDTIVTADESFEQDQLPEPPTWVNYLGELGDFIYSQLLGFFESSSRSPFSLGGGLNQTQAHTQGVGGPTRQGSSRANTPIEMVDELLDDFYYDQYENSQVLYYGPRLVRQGDIFEIGCYLPYDQPAEWTKSGKSLLVGAGKTGTNRSVASAHEGDDGTSDQQLLAGGSSSSSSLRLIKSGDFLNAKRNYSLKVFEAQPSDSGNYRCNRLSRKYHKLVVVPVRLPTSQLYLVQQRLLSVVGSSQLSTDSAASDANYQASANRHETTLSQQQIQLATLYQQQQQQLGPSAQQRTSARTRQPLTIQASGTSGGGGGATGSSEGLYSPMWTQRGNTTASGRPGGRYQANGVASKWPATAASLLIQGHLIGELQPLSVACHIPDELVLRKLRELPQFQLAWYKNGKLLRGSQSSSSSANNTSARQSALRPRTGQDAVVAAAARAPNTQRIQFLGPNGRQMFISSASFSDAGDYLCSWAKLAALVSRQSSSAAGSEQDGADSDASSTSPGDRAESSRGNHLASMTNQAELHSPVNPLGAASHHQLVAPVKLRPFKSAYYVRQHDQLRLFCQVQRGYPAAQISWYVGNQLVDADYLRDHPGEFRILQLQATTSGGGRGVSVLATPPPTGSGGGGPEDTSGQNQQAPNDQRPPPQIVEINPVPAGRQQMALTANGRGQWVSQADLSNERYAIDTPERQLRYLQMKLGQLTGASELLAAAAASDSAMPAQLPQQAGLSMLVVNKLDKERHSSRYACRATTRANTDEVTTVIRVKDTITLVKRPYGGSATLVPGRPLHFECTQFGNSGAQFVWYKRSIALDDEQPTQLTLLEPNMDDNIEIHNERLTLHRPTQSSVGDYICRALNDDRTESQKEFETIRLRAPPYVPDFGIETSHTGKSATIAEGQRLELLCQIQDTSVPVNITWLMSDRPESDTSMQPIPEVDQPPPPSAQSEAESPIDPGFDGTGRRGAGLTIATGDVPSYQAIQNVYVERIDRFAKKLVIREAGQQHRGHYACMVDNGVTERTRKFIYIRVKDRIVALWPFLGILAELFILFTIIYVWETQRAQKTLNAKSPPLGGGRNLVPPTTPYSTSAKRPPSGPTNAFESVPLNG